MKGPKAQFFGENRILLTNEEKEITTALTIKQETLDEIVSEDESKYDPALRYETLQVIDSKLLVMNT